MHCAAWYQFEHDTNNETNDSNTKQCVVIYGMKLGTAYFEFSDRPIERDISSA